MDQPSPAARPTRHRPARSQWAFTILEVLAVIAILMIMGVLIVPNYGSWMAKAAQAKCTANMRSLHLGLSTYLDDHGNVWPQGPSPDAGAEWAKFWISALAPQSISPRTWECPTIYGMLGNPPRNEINGNSIHYVPTMFDARPGTARRWPTQPWLIERADAHGNGALICFTDGSVKPFNMVMAEQGLR